MILVTGFEPFQGNSVNASMLLANSLDLNSVRVQILPVVHRKCFKKLLEVADKSVSHIIMLGEAKDRKSLNFESVAYNICDYRICDNESNMIKNSEIIAGKSATLLSSLDVVQLSHLELSVESEISTSAGRFVCNEIFYRALEYFEHTNVKVGFFHVPECISSDLKSLQKYKDSLLQIVDYLENETHD